LKVIANFNLKAEEIMRKKTMNLLLCLTLLIGFVIAGNAQEKTIVFVSRPGLIDVATGEHPNRLLMTWKLSVSR